MNTLPPARKNLLRAAAAALCALLAGCASGPGKTALAQQAAADSLAASSGKTTLRVLSYNIHHGEGTDKRYDIARTADTIAQYNPDIVAVQEVDRGTTRTEGDDQPALLAKRLGMKHVFGKCIPYRGGEYGILILSRFPIERSGMVLLPPPGQKEQRGLLAADLKLPSGKIIRLACVHLSTVSDGERAIQTGKINDLLLPDKSPTLLAGDFNARIGSNAMAGIEGAWTNSADSSFGKNTTPYRANAIDFIFFRKNDPFRVVETRTCQVPIVSDHNPVLSVLEIE